LVSFTFSYALGITTHELFEFAEKLPYADIETNSRVIQFVGRGNRMERPDTSRLPDSVWSVIQKLWVPKPQDRATARRAVSSLKKALPEARELDQELGNDGFNQLYARFVRQRET
jgi:Protein tyrosine and serine/threonine kinase